MKNEVTSLWGRAVLVEVLMNSEEREREKAWAMVEKSVERSKSKNEEKIPFSVSKRKLLVWWEMLFM